MSTDRWGPFWQSSWLSNKFDKSNPYMKFGGNQVINDYGRLSAKAN